MSDQRIPLFPLEMVVLPEEAVPLHIFEERYREMVADCEAAAAAGEFAEFGIAQSKEGGLSAVGCCLRIARILERHDDGRTTLLAMGTRRFRVLDVVEEKSYREADVEWVPDVEAEEAWDEALATDAFQLHKALIGHVTRDEVGNEVYSGLENLSWLIGSTCGMPPEIKQGLLESRSESERLRMLEGHIRILLPQMKVFDLMRQDIRQKWEYRSLEE